MEEEWTVDANEALSMSMVRPSDSDKSIHKIETFGPKFTYPIFGEDENIFGYKGLRINLLFDARDLRPNLSVTSSRKFKSVGEVEALDVKETLKEFLPGVAFQSQQEYEEATRGIPETWTPPGSLVKTVEKNETTYEIWQGTMADPAVKQMLRRIQFLVLLFIEGGSYIGVDENGKDDPEYSLARWSVFFVYKKEPKSSAPEKPEYTFQGFSTVYDFWMYQPPTPPASPGKEDSASQPQSKDSWELPTGDFPLNKMPRRARISQFIILPPYQGKGIGALLYDSIFSINIDDTSVQEIQVEDPNEDFDLLRDLCDMKYLRQNVPEFAALRINANVTIPEKHGMLRHNTQISSSASSSSSIDGIVDINALEKLRVKTKIAPRQFWRVVEMHLMSTLPDSIRPSAESGSMKPPASRADQKIYTLWRLLLKQRLYRRNISVLGEFEITERIIKLNETVGNVEWEYARILERVDAKSSTITNGKRKSNDELETGTPASKKLRTEEP
ncbi:histone acetyltransferase type B catalytic subunit [Xylariaceae sp. FL0016]|nr:histone acetyltransferase type B catalytic subunit [Xylariaceae sp. FL0016]